MPNCLNRASLPSAFPILFLDLVLTSLCYNWARETRLFVPCSRAHHTGDDSLDRGEWSQRCRSVLEPIRDADHVVSPAHLTWGQTLECLNQAVHAAGQV